MSARQNRRQAPARAQTPETAVVPFDPVSAGRDLRTAVDGRRDQLAALLGVDPATDRGAALLERFVTVALHAATSRPDILRATKESIVEAIRDAAMLGLEPVGITGDGSIVVYDETVKEVVATETGSYVRERRVPTAHFQPMYRGLLKVARRSSEIASIDSQVVYSGDRIEIDTGTNPSVRHFPELDGEKRGEVVGVYAYAILSNGQRLVDYMTRADVEVSRAQSRAKDAMAWTRFWAEMARKTVLRRLMKRLPSSTLAEYALRLDAEAELAATVSAVPAPQIEAGSDARDRLRARFVRPALGAGQDEDAGTTATAGSEGTETPEAKDSAVSVDPRGGEVEEGQTRPDPAVCGATSDPELGDVEACSLPSGHANPDETPSPHKGDSGAVWPNRKETK